MRRTASILLLFTLLQTFVALSAAAQDTPGMVRFPAAADSQYSLIRAANNSRTTLSSGITAASTTITVASTARFPASGLAQIDAEIIAYSSKTETTFTGLTRGADSTTAASHSGGAAVRGVVAAAHHNTLASAIIATQGKLGTGSTTPSSGKVLRGTSAGASAWGELGSSDLPASPTFSGTVTAGAFVANGEGITGLTGATGGVNNTGATTIDADSDADSVGKISLQIGNTEVAAIEADGTLNGILARQSGGSPAPAPAVLPTPPYYPHQQDTQFQSAHPVRLRDGRIFMAENTGDTENANTVIVGRYSTDGGLTYGAPVTISNPPSGRQWVMGGLGIDSQGIVYLAFIETNLTETETFAIRVMRSLNNTATWQTPVTLSKGSLTPDLYAPYGRISEGADGRVGVTWWAVDDYATNGTWYSLFSYTDDRGQTFSAPVTVASGLASQGRDYTETTAAYVGGGKWIALARVEALCGTVSCTSKTGPEQLLSADNGATWSSQGFVNSFGIKQQPNYLIPYESLDGERMLANLTNDAFGGIYRSYIMVEDALAGTSGWSPLELVYDHSHYAAYASGFATNEKGNLYVSYYVRRLGVNTHADVALQTITMPAQARRLRGRELTISSGTIGLNPFASGPTQSHGARFEGTFAAGSSYKFSGLLVDYAVTSGNAESTVLTVRNGTGANLFTVSPSGQTTVHVGPLYAPEGVIVKTPDGSACYRIRVDNAGALTSTATACPTAPTP
jgi:hypothetical protein